MIELSNSRGQVLLRLAGNRIQSSAGQTIAIVSGAELCNLQGQCLLEVREGKIYRGGSNVLLEVHDDEVRNQIGQVIATVKGGNKVEKSMLAAAFFAFL